MNNHYQNLNNVERQLLRHLLQTELLVFNNDNNNLFSIYPQNSYNTIAVGMEEYNEDKTNHVCSIVILRLFNKDYHFLKNRSNINKGNGYFEYTKTPTKITIPNCYEIEDISVNNTLEIISIIYKDKDKNRFIKLFKFQIPCFLGECVVLNSSLDLDNRFNFNYVKYYIKNNNKLEVKFNMTEPYYDSLVIEVDIYNKADNKPYLDLKYVYSS